MKKLGKPRVNDVIQTIAAYKPYRDAILLAICRAQMGLDVSDFSNKAVNKLIYKTLRRMLKPFYGGNAFDQETYLREKKLIIKILDDLLHSDQIEPIIEKLAKEKISMPSREKMPR